MVIFVIFVTLMIVQYWTKALCMKKSLRTFEPLNTPITQVIGAISANRSRFGYSTRYHTPDIYREKPQLLNSRQYLS